MDGMTTTTSREGLTTMSLRAAIIGLGNISNTHIAGWREAEGVEPVAGADVNEASVAAAAEKHGISGYAD